MSEKIRVNVFVDKQAWHELGKYITCSKSNWVNQQVIKRVNQHDDVAEIERKMHEIEITRNNLKMDYETLSEQRKQILQERKINEQNFKLINDAMFTIRSINNNQGFVEKTRVEFIANKFNLSYDVLEQQVLKENIEIKDIPLSNDTDTGETAPGYLK